MDVIACGLLVLELMIKIHEMDSSVHFNSPLIQVMACSRVYVQDEVIHCRCEAVLRLLVALQRNARIDRAPREITDPTPSIARPVTEDKSPVSRMRSL